MTKLSISVLFLLANAFFCEGAKELEHKGMVRILLENTTLALECFNSMKYTVRGREM